MLKLSFVKIIALLFYCLLNTAANAQNRIDTIRPDAPALAAYGNFTLGVRTLHVSHPNQLDIVKLDPKADAPDVLPRYTRELTLEVWYPAVENSQGTTSLNAFIRDGKTQVALHGKAVRDAMPLNSNQAFPLVIISHGYPGNRFLMAPLAENIASKGYVVVSIDHTDSTYRTLGAFASTTVNRPLDQLFTLNQIEQLAKSKQSFLFGLVNTNNTALIGYSMGAYGAVITAGAGVSQQAIESPICAPFGTLAIHKNNAQDAAKFDPRLKTVVAFAPWGMNHGVWEQDALGKISVPVLYIAGSQDDVSGYAKGVRALWQATSNVTRSLLTFDNANHSAGAPMPAPQESFVYNEELGIYLSDHYTDAVWDSTRMNNVSQHFVTAWLGIHLKHDARMNSYISLIPNANDGVWAKDKDGVSSAEHSYWAGFKNRTAKGLRFETLDKNK
jgi:predicted dienelactone hydrolase